MYPAFSIVFLFFLFLRNFHEEEAHGVFVRPILISMLFFRRGMLFQFLMGISRDTIRGGKEPLAARKKIQRFFLPHLNIHHFLRMVIVVRISIRGRLINPPCIIQLFYKLVIQIRQPIAVIDHS